MKIDNSDQARDYVSAQLLRVLCLKPSDAVISRALEDPAYYRTLEAARNNPAWLENLFELAEKNHHGYATSSPGFSKAIGAQIAYASARFAKSSSDEYESRWRKCGKCEHLKPNPGGVIYFLGRKIFDVADDRICALCGCIAQAKAKRATERCPGPDPVDPLRNRWGQLLKR